jgi:hypothetical protein
LAPAIRSPSSAQEGDGQVERIGRAFKRSDELPPVNV